MNDEKEGIESPEKHDNDSLKLDRGLIAPTVVCDYVRTKLKHIHGSRMNISAEGADKLVQVANHVLKNFLNQLSYVLRDLVVEISDHKTVAPKHIDYGYKILSETYKKRD